MATASIRMLTWLPIACTGYLIVEDDATRAVLLHSPLGSACLGIGITLNQIGRFWVRRLVIAS